MKRSTKILLPVLILVTAFAAMLLLLSFRTEPPKRVPEIRAKVVETAIVELQPVQIRITAYGRVTSAQPVKLYAEVSGTLEEGSVPFKPAQSFSKGDLLLKIDDRQARLKLNSLKSDLMTALANVLPEIKVDFPNDYQVWQDYFDSCRFDEMIAPLPETDNPRIKLFLSRFNVYKLYFSVCDHEILLDKHSFYVPFDGSIVSADLRVGSTARNGTLLGEIVNLEQLEVAVPVQVEDIRWIDKEQTVTFGSSEIPGKWTGKVTRIGSDIDTRTQTVDIYISVQSGRNASLLNGVFLEANIPGKTIDNAFAVPPRAVYDDRYVYIIVNGELARRDVEILRRETEQVIVDGGIEAGDTLVIEIMQGVAPGMPARSKNATSENRGR
ncbi:MAG: HlyD family efflux transporter periplasmic adaptor subunit [candidate division Zixibacteria bacterium]|nr:HlyD family efflux transporter periplasmic adaptor subunit [candidate division Zixibacteria bacterium]